MTNHTRELISGGFLRVGEWEPDQAGSIRYTGLPLPKEAGVYAYVVEGTVRYVGSAQRGLHRRLRHYEIAKTLRTSARVRMRIMNSLSIGHAVEVFVIIPPPLMANGLPIDPVAGLEVGLIRYLRPDWNLRGRP